jgi:glutamate synthase (NADPH/NADH) large chain
VLDLNQDFVDLYNHESVDIQRINTEATEAHRNHLYGLLQAFVDATGSRWGQTVLEGYDDYVRRFWLVKPKAAELGSLLDSLVQRGE